MSKQLISKEIADLIHDSRRNISNIELELMEDLNIEVIHANIAKLYINVMSMIRYFPRN